MENAEMTGSYTTDGLFERGAKPLMRWLLDAVRSASNLTYGRAADLLETELNVGTVFPTHVGGVAGTMMEKIHAAAPDAPLINVLVVNKDGVPGNGIAWFLGERFGPRFRNYEHFTTKDKREIATRAAQEVYAYRKWPQLYSKVFGDTLPQPSILSIQGKLNEEDGKSPDGRQGSGGESLEHRRLKEYIRQHPSKLKISNSLKALPDEVPLLSGDLVDVGFTGARQMLLIEVKSRRSDWSDLQRGIYQCIKYQAVARAQRDTELDAESIHVMLVTEDKLPPDLLAKARRLGLRTKVVRVPDRYLKHK